MPYKDPEKKKENARIYYQKNKGKIKNNVKNYSDNNKLIISEYKKQYYMKNKEKYFNDESIKNNRITKWKKRGVISEDYNKLYDYYLSIEECENCGIELNQDEGTRKCLDHNHETGQFRQILCHTCNILRG